MTKLIYAKSYPDQPAQPENRKESGIFSGFSPEEWDRLFDACEYRLLQERVEDSKKFVELAISYSEESKTTVEINQGEEYIHVRYYLGSRIIYGDNKDTLAELLKRSDWFSICPPADNGNKDIVLVLLFQTHECYKRWEFM